MLLSVVHELVQACTVRELSAAVRLDNGWSLQSYQE